MISSRAYHGLQFTIAPCSGSSKVCYILLPEGLHSDGEAMIERCAETYSCTIIMITGMDWNRDLTPWPAEGVFKREKPFDGKARDFLKELLTDYFPGIENSMSIHNPERMLIGVSLSGLFAVWSLFQSDTFKAIASISGSMWYDSFTEWVSVSEIKNSAVKIYLSLGDKEKESKNRRMAVVEDATNAIADILRGKGCSVTLRIVPGTHFSPIIPRLEAAFESILG